MFRGLSTGVRALSVLGEAGGGGDLLARKIYAIPECLIDEIGTNTLILQEKETR